LSTQIKAAFADEYIIPHIASFAFALWFYRFDQDNWGSFERYRRETEKYLGFLNENQTLILYKGVQNFLIFPVGVSVTDLVVVHNADEQTISIFTARLLD
jgi:hypothetical protein